MNSEDLLNFILKKLTDLIFELEQMKVEDEKYTIEIKNSKGIIIKTIQI